MLFITIHVAFDLAGRIIHKVHAIVMMYKPGKWPTLPQVSHRSGLEYLRGVRCRSAYF